MMKRRKFWAILLAAGMIFAVAAAGCKPESAHTHEYGEWTTVKEATCGEKGLKEKTCSCGAKIEEEIAATGEHNYVWTTETEATCGAEGNEKGVCSECQAETERTLPTTGEHSYVWTTETEATCGAEGKEKGVCSVCQAETERTLPATGEHNYAWAVEIAATCGAEGKEKGVCSVCQAETERTLPATGEHNYAWTVKTAATCAAAGKKEGVCSVCDDKITEDIPIDASAHTGNYSEWTIEKQPTATEKGKRTRFCRDCNAKFEEDIEPTGEDPDLPVFEVRNYTLFINKEGVARFEAESGDITHYVRSSANPTTIVERSDASGGRFLAAATGAVQDGQYLEFKINLPFSAELKMTAAYAQPEKWKSFSEDMRRSYLFIVDENRNMSICSEKVLLDARTDITKWDTFDYNEITLPEGEHSIRMRVAEDTGRGNPNIDYFDFVIKKAEYVPAPDVKKPTNDFHTANQYAYITDADVENISAYAVGVAELSRPEGTLLDFTEDAAVSGGSYVLQYADNANFTGAVTVENLTEKSCRIYNLKLGEKIYWRVGTSLENAQNGEVREFTVADKGPRNLYISGVTNVRDIGGYSSSLAEGAKIRQGLYYRGANLNGITEKGKAEMLRLGIRREIDLRDSYQCLGPYVDGIAYSAVSIPSGTESTRFEAFGDEYKKIFSLIANADAEPVYLHCTAGADRTGICSFMLLTVCGAGYDDIARDYLFTNFSTQGSRVNNFTTEFKQWWSKLDDYSGDTKAERAKSWLMSKGITGAQVEKIREIFVEGYKA